MRKFDFQKYKRGIITVEIQSFVPEKIINILWKNGVNIKNVRRKNITTICFDTNLKDYSIISDIVKRTDTRIKIISRKGISFFFIKTRRRQTLIGGVIIFVGVIYYLSTFIWGVNVITERSVTPYEIRHQLESIGVKPGISKDKIDVYALEEKIVKDNSDIMWVRARVEGAKLNVTIAERQEPPEIVVDDAPCNIVAKKDGEVIRVYSKAGTAAVKPGDIVKKGSILVKGEQGKEGGTYLVHADAEIIARTFYEEKVEVPITKIERERTGLEDKEIYIEVFGKKIYLNKSRNEFKNSDKVFVDRPFIKKRTYYEVNEKSVKVDKSEIEQKTANELFSNIIVKLDKSVKIVDKIVDLKENNDKYEVRVMLVVEENIAKSQKMQESEIEKFNKKDEIDEKDKNKVSSLR